MRDGQIHLKNRELENTKLSVELQMLKSVDVNKENTIAQFKEEVGRLQLCLADKEKQHREVLAKVSPLVRPPRSGHVFRLCCPDGAHVLCLGVSMVRRQGEVKALKEQLRQKEEQLHANQQQSSLLAAELRDASSARDRTMSELYHVKVEADALRQARSEAQDQCVQLERLVEQMKTEAKQSAVRPLILLMLMLMLMLRLWVRRTFLICSCPFPVSRPRRRRTLPPPLTRVWWQSCRGRWRT